MAINQVVKVITVGNAFMCTVEAVHMSLVMSATLVTGRTLIGVCRIHFERMFVNMIEVHVMQVAIMQIVGVAGMSDSHVSAGGPVLMAVPLMLLAVSHRDSP